MDEPSLHRRLSLIVRCRHGGIVFVIGPQRTIQDGLRRSIAPTDALSLLASGGQPWCDRDPTRTASRAAQFQSGTYGMTQLLYSARSWGFLRAPGPAVVRLCPERSKTRIGLINWLIGPGKHSAVADERGVRAEIGRRVNPHGGADHGRLAASVC